MYATIRRYEGVDTTRTNEVTDKVKETLVPPRDYRYPFLASDE